MMNKLKLALFSILLLGYPLIPLSAQEKGIYDLFLEAQEDGLSGVLLVAEEGEPIFFEATGFREYESGKKLKKDDIFELASISKQFTSMLVMMCEEKGLLDFDDPLDKYIQTPYSGITLRQLLTHTSGLPDYAAVLDEHWDKSKIAGNEEILEYLREYAPPIEFQPGEDYQYSNTGYVLLGSVVEEVTGKDFVELSREWIFEPLGLKDTDIRSIEEKGKVKNFALGHQKDESGDFVDAANFPSSNYIYWLGGRKGPGRVSGTVEDLLIWDQALYTEKLIKQETLEEAFRPQKLNDGSLSSYGFGWDLEVEEEEGPLGQKVMHTGSNPGYRNIFVRFLDAKKTIILLTNNAYPGRDQLVEDIASLFE